MTPELWDVVKLTWFAGSILAFVAFVIFVVSTHGRPCTEKWARVGLGVQRRQGDLGFSIPTMG